MADYGCDPSAVTLANWRTRPHSKWAFQNAAMLVPTVPIAGGGGGELPEGDDAGLDRIATTDGSCPLPDFLQAAGADEMLVVKSGRAVWRWRAAHRSAARPHLFFSISKSLTGLVAGALADQGVLDIRRTVADFVPGAARSGFGDCPIRHLLDMRVSLSFAEDYLNQDGDYARYRRAMLWNPVPPGYAAEPLADMLSDIAKGPTDHGGVFRYLSPNSDMLGLVVETAAGAPFAQVLSEMIWQPLGCNDAQITVDGAGAPRTAGGVSGYADDLARVAGLVLAGGDGLISEAWIADMQGAGDETAWSTSHFADFIPGGRYRSHWYQFPAPSRAFMAVGIHGQWLYMDPVADVVVVVLSSNEVPEDDLADQMMIALLKRIAEVV